MVRAMIDLELQDLRNQIDTINRDLLTLMNRRLRVVEQVKVVKERTTESLFNPARESRMFDKLLLANEGPMTTDLVRHLFKEIFKLSLDHMEADTRKRLHVHRREGEPDRRYDLRGHTLGGGPKHLIAGPSSVESIDQVDAVAAHVARLGGGFLQGGAFKPRTSPYSFQGHGAEGLRMLREAADRHGLAVITEILDPGHFEAVAEYTDVFSVGSRNMYNYELLRLLGQADKPVLLNRGFMATLNEFIHAAEYVAKEGNNDLILCERGIRTHERWTRYTLDLSAVALLKQETPFPIVVDLAQGLGRKDVMIPMARAALAAGADAIAVQVHPQPALALSDNEQQMSLEELSGFYAAVFPVT
jgi:3-deoxy-7-phosphoheptulonate synthase/chorismate mutase